MSDHAIDCPECDARMHGPRCKKCGWTLPKSEPTRYQPPWRQPGFKFARLDDACPEPDCGKTVRDHLEECKQRTGRLRA